MVEKLCDCGCGQPSGVYAKTDKRRGIVKGQPRRFLPHHHGVLDVADRFWSMVDIRSEDECWPWTRSLRNKWGYGGFTIGSKRVVAGRVAYELTHGELPDDQLVLHHCDNPICCNPNHLYAGDAQDNSDDMHRRGRYRNHWSEKTHCVHGHEFTEENTYVTPEGYRYCKKCRRRRGRELLARRRVNAMEPCIEERRSTPNERCQLASH